jgi:beta-1,4-N-acetylglucosaminyltransferase
LLDCRIVYVESIARVERLSLSGKILHASRMADLLFVQWPEMAKRYKGATYAGRLY